MKTGTRAIAGACIALGALVGAATVASAYPTIVTSVVPEPGDVTPAINSDAIDRVDAPEIGRPLPTDPGEEECEGECFDDCEGWYVEVYTGNRVRVCVE